uniref:Polynucleotide adenylyltransferase n=1 Tax=Meloidogyne floridensis TaxID=298350 RepID=A0A915P9X9_9BILA
MVDLEQNEESILIQTPTTTTKAKMSKKKRDREKKKILEFKNLGKESVDESLDIEMKDVEDEEPNIETPSTSTKAKMSKKKRDREKKKNLELKNLEKKSADESLDNKMKDIEEEVHPKIIDENISTGSSEMPVTEAVKGELEGPKIGEQETAEKPIMKNAKVNTSKFSKGKDKTNSNKNVKANHGKMDKKEDINAMVKNDVKLKQTNELTLFEENNELIDILKGKGFWKNLRKSNMIDKTISLEEAIADVIKTVELWNKNAFTLISGSYLLNINSVESDVDFIIVLPFDYNDPKDRFVTKRMVDDEFMGIRSECDFEKREECSEKKSLYCLLCENKATTWLRKITTGVNEINAKIHDYSFDLAFVAYPWGRDSRQVLSFIESEKGLKNLNEIDNFILNFTQQFGTNLQYDRVGMINSLSDHFIYNGKLGFFSGTSLAILVTKIFFDHNCSKLTINQILAKEDNNTPTNKQKIDSDSEAELKPIILEETNKNFEELRQEIDWNEANERESRNKFYINNTEKVLRVQIMEKQKFLEEASNAVSDKEILEKEILEKQLVLEEILEQNAKMGKHTKLIWPIITAGLPKQNAGFNINVSTRKIMWREMEKGIC